jgi:dTDP-4-amino-4,6-dideoxygalactose transaminase
MIPVNRTFLPPIAAFEAQLDRVWKNQWITNRGELVNDLEGRLKAHLGIPYITLMTNGTLPIQIALKVLAEGGEVITTPFSYVATTSSIVWEGCTPVFVDIHPEHLTIDETKIEAAITPRTTAILATHVFGNPCNVQAIAAIASKHGLKVIYDAAHCFGVSYNGESIFTYGDVSTCSFHATKVFHTAEGGAVMCADLQLQQKLYHAHNFGHNGPLAFHGLGINGKMSELQAAMGLCVLPHMPTIFAQRRTVVEFYDEQLKDTPLQRLRLREGTEWNYSHYPVIFETEQKLLEVVGALNKAEIYPRRYFYPSLNTLPYVKQVPMPVSDSIASRVACLPLFAGMPNGDPERVMNELLKHF